MSSRETLEDIYDAIREDKAFEHMRKPGIVLVPGEGSLRPKVLIVGEAPGATENTAKRPFVGASGRVLRSLMTDVAGLRDDEYFITNVVKYRPEGNRTPVPYEVSKSVPYLRREWKALHFPKVIVAVGGTAKNALKPELPGVTQSTGKAYPTGRGGYVFPMLHPAYGLRVESAREAMEVHWEEFGRWLRSMEIMWKEDDS